MFTIITPILNIGAIVNNVCYQETWANLKNIWLELLEHLRHVSELCGQAALLLSHFSHF